MTGEADSMWIHYGSTAVMMMILMVMMMRDGATMDTGSELSLRLGSPITAMSYLENTIAETLPKVLLKVR